MRNILKVQICVASSSDEARSKHEILLHCELCMRDNFNAEKCLVRNITRVHKLWQNSALVRLIDSATEYRMRTFGNST